MNSQCSRSFLALALVGCAALAQSGCSGTIDGTDGERDGGTPGTAGSSGGSAGRASGGSAGVGGAGAGGRMTDTAGTGGVGTAGTGGSAGKGGSGGGAGRGGSGGAAGGGRGGSGGSGGGGGVGPTSCQPQFETACKPNINVMNNDPTGAKNFTDAITDPVATMKDVACIVCSILFRTPDEIPSNRRHTTINLTLEPAGPPAFAGGNSLTISTNHIRNFTGARARTEFLGVMVHETVHLYQNYGNGGTGEGMADCVRVRVALYEQGRCNRGGSWRDAYTTSGCFYSWLTGPSAYHTWAHDAADPDIPYKINKALAGTNGDAAYTAISNLLQQTFGQSVDALWTAYQADL
jgi:hypothetical protein